MGLQNRPAGRAGRPLWAEILLVERVWVCLVCFEKIPSLYYYYFKFLRYKIGRNTPNTPKTRFLVSRLQEQRARPRVFLLGFVLGVFCGCVLSGRVCLVGVFDGLHENPCLVISCRVAGLPGCAVPTDITVTHAYSEPAVIGNRPYVHREHRGYRHSAHQW